MENSEQSFPESNKQISISLLTRDDLTTVARVHQAAFPKSALTHLGHEAVRRYYEWQLTGPHDCLAIGAFDAQGRMLGFCFGGLFRGALSGFVQKNRRFLALQVLRRPWLIFTNDIFRDRLRTGMRVAKRRNTHSQVSSEQDKERPFGILSIAVDPSAQGQGVGQQLMQYSEEYAKAQGFSYMRLSVAKDNLQAIHFYEMGRWVKDSASLDWDGGMTKKLA